ncbi:MAG: DUF928 domain-containing protein [Mojavia pulchra JT2-VF2]|jgi:hypothetical protein|uniref:DUF928 domain-containing protein n=1 Tax=Mojavia pulchra JT2-VF2 TaxID=287848 RepID=A0A951PY94_9NOST|nr:DUF928 domain-containing protein [Mojavia pulchra JT2-VF2]
MKQVIHQPKTEVGELWAQPDDGFVAIGSGLKHLLQTCFIPLILLNIVSYPLQVHAQVTTQPVKKAVSNTQNRLAQLKFPRNGAPIGRRQGGARRTGTQCPDLKTPITALVPGEETLNESESFLALTVSEYPTFWVYVPHLPTNLRTGEFVFQDEKGKDIYRTPLTLADKPGVIGISLPPSPQYALKQGSKYQWYFKVYCGAPQTTSEYFYVKAWVQRIALTSELKTQLNTSKPGEYVAYAVNYIWQDAVTNLAQMHRTNSSSRVVAEDWTNLLTSVGLSEFASAPIVARYGSEKL